MNKCGQCNNKAKTHVDLGNEKRWLCSWHLAVYQESNTKHKVNFVRASQL